VIDVGAIWQHHIADDVFVLIVAMLLDRSCLPKHEGRQGLFGLVAIRLAFLVAVNAVEADALRMFAVQDFEGIAVKDGDYLASEIGSECGAAQEKQCASREPKKRESLFMNPSAVREAAASIPSKALRKAASPSQPARLSNQ